MKVEYLAVYGRASMGVLICELQYGTVLYGHVPWVTCAHGGLWLVSDWAYDTIFFVFCRGQKRDLSRVSQRARGATKNGHNFIKF